MNGSASALSQPLDKACRYSGTEVADVDLLASDPNRRLVSYGFGGSEQSQVPPLSDNARQYRAETIRAHLSNWSTPLYQRLLFSCLGVAALVQFSHDHLDHVVLPALAIVFVAATLSSVAGFAFSAICGAMLFYVMPPIAAVQLMMVCSIAIQAASVLALRSSIDWRVLARFVGGGVVSIPLGVYLLLQMDKAIYCHLLGVFLVLYGVYMLCRPATTLRFERPWADTIAGLAGGVTGGLVGFPGAFVTIWCGLKGWDKSRQRGVYQPFILIMQILGLFTISCFAAASPRALPACGIEVLVYVPAAVLGTWCGLGWYRRLSDAQFSTVVNLLLIVSGAALAI